MSIELPLFPLHSVLCPGVALPLHIFEERYRLMIGRCIERREPFGVVLLREGHEVGPAQGRIVRVGTTAVIRQASRYADGRMDIVTVGDRRFRVEAMDRTSEPWLVGRVRLLEEPLGEAGAAQAMAVRVGPRFIRYLELLQPEAPGPGSEVEIEVEVDDGDETDDQPRSAADLALGPDDVRDRRGPEGSLTDDAALDDRQRRALLMASARRLVRTDDPTTLSYLLTALVQVDAFTRQKLLEAPDTLTRLTRLDALLVREVGLLGRHLRPLIIERGTRTLRDN